MKEEASANCWRIIPTSSEAAFSILHFYTHTESHIFILLNRTRRSTLLVWKKPAFSGTRIRIERTNPSIMSRFPQPNMHSLILAGLLQKI